MDDRTDAQLIEAYRKGDQRALSFLIQKYLSPVYRFLYRLVGEGSTAEDLAQDTFVKAWKSLSKFDTAKSFKTWVFSIAKNTAIDFLRKKQPVTFSSMENEDRKDFAETIADDQPLPPELLEQSDLSTFLAENLAKIPPNARSIVLMHDAEDMTFQEIAGIMKEPLNTVKSRYRRALDALRKLIKKP